MANVKFNYLDEVINGYKHIIEVAADKVEHLSKPEIYGCCICSCNTIIVNRERLMTVKVENNKTDFEFFTLTPTFFLPKMAKEIIKNDIYRDSQGEKIKMEGVNELEYFKMLLDRAEQALKTLLPLNR